MKSKMLFSISVIILVTFSHTKPARTCSCLPPPPPAKAFAEADAVLMGKVVSFELLPSMDRRMAGIAVLKIWKGEKNDADSIFTGPHSAACGYDFEVGQTYVIYAFKDEGGKLYTHLCTRTAPVEQATEDLKFLESLSYFPLAIGNSWKFAYAHVENIVDTIRVDSQLYYRFDRFRGFSDALIRMSGEGKLFMRSDTTEQLWLDFAAEIGDKWTVYGQYAGDQWTVSLESKNDTIRVPAGTFLQCYRFLFDFGCCDNSWVEWYAPEVGPVKRDLYGFAVIEYPLESAVVNGTSLPTSVSEKPTGEFSRTFELAQNYPNPFNPTTVICYDLSVNSRVVLKIFNILGQEVRTLVDGKIEMAGRYAVSWDGKDNIGNPIATGIYLYCLETSKAVQMKKMTLLR